jgi:hypothetical protein
MNRLTGVLPNRTARRDELCESLDSERLAAEVRASCNSALRIVEFDCFSKVKSYHRIASGVRGKVRIQVGSGIEPLNLAEERN